MTTRSWSRRRQRFAGRRAAAALAVVVALGIAGRSGHAEEADPFSATVTVDATADNAAKAREKARLDGQRRALGAIAEKLAGGAGQAGPAANAAGRLAKLDDKAITDLVASFEVANERMSAVRYAADYTFHFRPGELRKALRTAGVALADDGAKPDAGKPDAAKQEAGKPDAGKPPVVIPVYQAGGQSRLWEDPNPWRDAWDRLPSGVGGNAKPPLAIPLGDAGDVAAIDADKARTGNPEALAAIARRNGGGEVVVVLAETGGPAGHPEAVEVTTRRYRDGRLVDSHLEAVSANTGEGEAELLRRAAAAAATGIESGWKKQAVPGYDQVGTLTAVLPIASLDDWVRARERLAGVPAIRKIALASLSRQEATIEIGYGGSIDQLKASLAGIGLDLVRGDPLWRLARIGPDRSP